MIGYLKGALLSTAPDLVLLDVGGVGYEVRIPLSTYYQVQKIEPGGTACLLHPHPRPRGRPGALRLLDRP